jgi:ADP-ribose pyrophosphatase YjhB (NUDIX family)
VGEVEVLDDTVYVGRILDGLADSDPAGDSGVESRIGARLAYAFPLGVARRVCMADRVLAGVVFILGGKLLLVLGRKGRGVGRARWSIPKGRYREADGDLFGAALREMTEETGIDLARLEGTSVREADCTAKGTIAYMRNGRSVELHYFVVERREAVLDSSATAAEVMAAVGFFAPDAAVKLIRREQRPLLEALGWSLPGTKKPAKRRMPRAGEAERTSEGPDGPLPRPPRDVGRPPSCGTLNDG